MIDVNWPAVCRLEEMSGRIDACACSLLVCLVLSSVVVHLGADIVSIHIHGMGACKFFLTSLQQRSRVSIDDPYPTTTFP